MRWREKGKTPNEWRISRRERVGSHSKIARISRAKRSTACAGWAAFAWYPLSEHAEEHAWQYEKHDEHQDNQHMREPDT